MREVGGLAFAAPQDWMCEPHMVARTGLSVMEHQRRTVESYRTLCRLAPSVPWCPVVQGYTIDEYLECVRMYDDAGIPIRSAPVVGVGSVCRREASSEIEDLVYALHGAGLRGLHGFGVKRGGLARVGHLLASSDSMAWSATARRRGPMIPGHRHTCSHCLEWAMAWRAEVIGAASVGGQMPLPLAV
jgi:hypothetical protein